MTILDEFAIMESDFNASPDRQIQTASQNTRLKSSG